jgi:hypothetical protein
MDSPGGERDKIIKTVVLFGSSLAVSSIGASLESCPGLRVLAVDSATATAGEHGAAQGLAALRPDVVLFDLATVPTDFAIALWKARPGTLLIGIDLLANQALVLSGQPARAHTTDDLLQVIQRHEAHGDRERGWGRGGDTETGRHLAKYARCSSDGDTEIGDRDRERVGKVSNSKSWKGERK